MPPSNDDWGAMDTQYEDDERKDSIYGQYSKTNSALARYLPDFDAGGVTTVVAVHNMVEKKETSIKYTIADTDIAGVVTVYVGAMCPDTAAASNTVTMVNTGKISNTAVMRYLERGKFYCLQY